MQLDENQISIDLEHNGKKYYLVCDKSSLLGELFDAVSIFKNHVLNTMQNIDQVKDKEDGK